MPRPRRDPTRQATAALPPSAMKRAKKIRRNSSRVGQSSSLDARLRVRGSASTCWVRVALLRVPFAVGMVLPSRWWASFLDYTACVYYAYLVLKVNGQWIVAGLAEARLATRGSLGSGGTAFPGAGRSRAECPFRPIGSIRAGLWPLMGLRGDANQLGGLNRTLRSVPGIRNSNG